MSIRNYINEGCKILKLALLITSAMGIVLITVIEPHYKFPLLQIIIPLWIITLLVTIKL